MKEDREKELKRLIYLRSELIKECKKDIKNYHRELDDLYPKPKTKSKKISYYDDCIKCKYDMERD